MRRLGGVGLLVAGAAAALLGALLAVAFGPDDRMATGPHPLRSEHPVITTTPQAIGYAGPRTQLQVRSRGEPRHLFVGVGHHVDVANLLGDTPRTLVHRIDLPWRLGMSQAGTGGPMLTSPLQVPWWYAKDEGRGRAVLSWTLPERGGDVVIAALDARGGLAVDVTAAVLAPGVFVVGLAMVVIGLGCVLLGWALLTTRARPRGLHAERGEVEA